jgi:hypothetical protein
LIVDVEAIRRMNSRYNDSQDHSNVGLEGNEIRIPVEDNKILILEQ